MPALSLSQAAPFSDREDSSSWDSFDGGRSTDSSSGDWDDRGRPMRPQISGGNSDSDDRGSSSGWDVRGNLVRPHIGPQIAAVSTAASVAAAPPAAPGSAVGGDGGRDPSCSLTLLQQQCNPQHPPPESPSPGAQAYWTNWRARCCRFFAPLPAAVSTNALQVGRPTVAVSPGVLRQGSLNPVKLAAPQQGLGMLPAQPVLRDPVARLRTDISPNAPINSAKPALQLDTCIDTLHIPVPRFATARGGPMDAQLQTLTWTEQVQVPARLASDVVRKAKAYVMSKMHTFDPVMGTIGPDPVRSAYLNIKRVNRTSGFVHPSGTLGPAELALLQVRWGAAAVAAVDTFRPDNPHTVG